MAKQHPTHSFPWALDDDGLALLAAHLDAMRPPVAVEFGSGKTTPLLRRYAGHTVSLEHLPEWAEKTKLLCREQRPRWWRRLGRSARNTGDLQLVDIVSIDTPVGRLPVYDATLPARVDFALIDGPPKSIGRLGAMFQLFPSLNNDAIVWLDDVNRPEEIAVLDVWQQHFPLEVELVSERIAQIRVAST